jgi:hypothetical protein
MFYSLSVSIPIPKLNIDNGATDRVKAFTDILTEAQRQSILNVRFHTKSVEMYDRDEIHGCQKIINTSLTSYLVSMR